MRAFRIDPAVGQPEASWLVEWGGQVLYQGQSPGRIGRALAAGRMGEEVLVAGEEGLLLLDAEGKLMEQIHHSLLPPGHLQRCGVREGILICETSEGIYQLRQWPRGEPAGPEGVRWFDLAAEPPPEVREAAARAYRGEGLPLSRVVLDLHSGRMFGTLGVVLYDLAALVFLALVGTGLFLALRNRR